MKEIMLNFNNEKLNLTDLHKNLEQRYEKYKREYKNSKTKHPGREARDKEFLGLLIQYKANEVKSEADRILSLYRICKFYVENVNSGFWGRTPELIRYIRYPLYLVFSLQNLRLTNPYSTFFQPPLIDNNGNAADVIKKRLYEELKFFCDNFERYKSQEYKLQIV